MLLSTLATAVLLVLLLARQVQVRRVPARVRLQRPAITLLLGGYLAVGASGDGSHPIRPAVLAILAASFAVGLSLSACRASMVRLWYRDKKLVRQGDWRTVALWLLGLGLHEGLASVLVIAMGGPAELVPATGVLYLGLSSLTQQIVLVHRANRYRVRVRQWLQRQQEAQRSTGSSDAA